MGETFYKVPDSTIYRKVSDELVVIQLDTGKFYYFNPETQEFLDHFKTPQDFDALLSRLGDQQKELKQFFEFLEKNKIVERTNAEASPSHSSIPEGSPAFLREGEKSLDEITFLCP